MEYQVSYFPFHVHITDFRFRASHFFHRGSANIVAHKQATTTPTPPRTKKEQETEQGERKEKVFDFENLFRILIVRVEWALTLYSRAKEGILTHTGTPYFARSWW